MMRITARELSSGAASPARPSSSFAGMDPHARAESVWYRIAGLLSRKELAIDITEGEIRSAQHEVLLDGPRSSCSPASRSRIFARQLRDRAERTIPPTSKS
jgi:hypothetical protein